MKRATLAASLVWLLSVAATVAAAVAVARAQGQDAGALPSEHQPQLQVSVLPDRAVRVGEIAHVRIGAVVPVGDDVTVVEQSFAPFEVQKKRARVEPPSGGKQRFVFELDLLALEPGDAKVPAVELRVVTKDGFVGDVKTSPLPYSVRSWLGNEPNAQPKHETKPVVVMQDNYLPLYVLGALAAIALGALLTLLVSRYLRKRRARAVPPPPPRPPWEIAVEKLGVLRKQKQRMLEAGEGAQFVDQVSDVVREYLGGRHGFDGLETTTDEMLGLLRGRAASLLLTQDVAQFLGRCDLVKFAKVTPDQDEVDLVLTKAQQLVGETAPVTAAEARAELPHDGGEA